ncbi:hypothetical protein VXQ18_04375 [Brucella abortus]|nr:hypothetical protein [Brucella abortus]
MRLSAMIIGMLLATAADVLTPLYSGRLVDSLSLGSNAWDAAIHALIALLSLVRWRSFRGRSRFMS